jgi:hypothetical protein
LSGGGGRRLKPAAASALLSIALTAIAHAQIQRPRVEVAAVTPAPGASTLSLKVSMPKDVHIQSDKPRDPLLIPTALKITPPSGVKVEKIVYPKPTDLKQTGRGEPLAVFGPELTIDVDIAVDEGAAAELVVPAELRYQACNEKLCFPPARATTQWVIRTR